jgi:hypothetical protein
MPVNAARIRGYVRTLGNRTAPQAAHDLEQVDPAVFHLPSRVVHEDNVSGVPGARMDDPGRVRGLQATPARSLGPLNFNGFEIDIKLVVGRLRRWPPPSSFDAGKGCAMDRA